MCGQAFCHPHLSSLESEFFALGSKIANYYIAVLRYVGGGSNLFQRLKKYLKGQ